MLWIGIHFPSLAIEAFGQPPPTRHGDDAPALAVCAQGVVLQACPRAQAQGVAPGMKRATALALLPRLLLRDRDPALEHDTLTQAANWALQFTPSVSLQNPPRDDQPAAAGLLLEVAASLRLFGGLPSLQARLREGLARLGLRSTIGCAPTATGAWLMARHRDGLSASEPADLEALLDSLPVSVLESAASHLDVLETLGVRSLRDLRALPRAGLARRFGAVMLREIDRAFGRAPEPRAWFEATAVFSARLELPAALDDAPSLLAAARRLLSSLCGWLAARQAAACAVTLSLTHDDPPVTTLTLQPAEPSASEARLTALLRERLAATRLRAPADTLRLDCDTIVACATRSGNLFPMQDQAREGLGRLVEQLQARLGRDRVLLLTERADHRPERACRLERASFEALSSDAGTRRKHGVPPAPQAELPRPLWLLEQPKPLTERQQRPWLKGPLALLAGPERIETGWWDGHLVQRDYFIATDDDGLLLWIYRERPSQDQAGAGWFLQGRFG
jgi:protein ImuB